MKIHVQQVQELLICYDLKIIISCALKIWLCIYINKMCIQKEMIRYIYSSKDIKYFNPSRVFTPATTNGVNPFVS